MHIAKNGGDHDKWSADAVDAGHAPERSPDSLADPREVSLSNLATSRTGQPHMPSTNERSSAIPWRSAECTDLLRDARILIVDDATLYRECLAARFAADTSVPPSVAWDLWSMIAALEEHAPNVVLLNIETRDTAMLLRQVAEISPTARVIVFGLSEDDESDIIACAEAGVAGYHLRTESLENLLALVRKVAVGESLVSPRVSAMLLRRLSVLAAQRQPTSGYTVLTRREAEILRMLELGLSNRDIANRLCIAVHTVKNHVHNLLTKLGVSTRAEAAALCRTALYREAEEDSVGA